MLAIYLLICNFCSKITLIQSFSDTHMSVMYIFRYLNKSLYLLWKRDLWKYHVRWERFPCILSGRLFRIKQRCIMYGQNGHVGRVSLNLTCATLLLHVNLDISHRHPAYFHRASSPTSSISCFSRAGREKSANWSSSRAFTYPYFNHESPQIAGV